MAGIPPVGQVAVNGTWSGVASGTASATADGGQVAIYSDKVLDKKDGVVFTVDSIVHASLTYEPNDNIETSIIVYQDGSTENPQPLLASGGLASATPIGDLTEDLAEATAKQALTLWSQQLVTVPKVEVSVADLPAGTLGWTIGKTITLDINADGEGWCTDLNAPVAGRFDLLTVVSHEIGHLLGYGHSDHHENLMAATLPQGTRRLPAVGPATTRARLDSILVSPLLLPELWLSGVQSDRADDAVLRSEPDNSIEADMDNLLFPMPSADNVDRVRTRFESHESHLLNDITDEETELLDEELLALLAARYK